MRITYKIWLDNDDGRAFGEGPYRLLKGVEMTGSLLGAAAGLGMSYSKARLVIARCERRLGFVLTEKKRGGVSGGGSQVTDPAIELMRAYEALRAEIEEAVGEAYKRHFGSAIQVRFYTMKTHKRGARKATAE
jgi:molybdate transport system regulatory protein